MRIFEKAQPGTYLYLLYPSTTDSAHSDVADKDGWFQLNVADGKYDLKMYTLSNQVALFISDVDAGEINAQMGNARLHAAGTYADWGNWI